MRLDYDPALEGWKTLLAASKAFNCPRLRAEAISALEEKRGREEAFSAMIQVQLALKYDIEAWLRPAYVQIVQRAEMLSGDEIAQLPATISLLLGRSRERYHSSGNQHHVANGVDSMCEPLSSVHETAKAVFEDQLAALNIDVMGRSVLGELGVYTPEDLSLLTDILTYAGSVA